MRAEWIDAHHYRSYWVLSPEYHVFPKDMPEIDQILVGVFVFIPLMVFFLLLLLFVMDYFFFGLGKEESVKRLFLKAWYAEHESTFEMTEEEYQAQFAKTYPNHALFITQTNIDLAKEYLRKERMKAVSEAEYNEKVYKKGKTASYYAWQRFRYQFRYAFNTILRRPVDTMRYRPKHKKSFWEGIGHKDVDADPIMSNETSPQRRRRSNR